jgi:hypothetical protein
MQVPVDELLRGELPPFAEELLSSRALRDTGYFSPEKVAALRKRHRTGQEDVGQVFFAELGTQIWQNLFCRASTARQHA